MAKSGWSCNAGRGRCLQAGFRVPPEEVAQVSKFFDQARKDSRGFEPYARQVAGMFADNPAVLEASCLSVIAKADGVVHPAEVTYLRSVSNIFGLDDHAFERITTISGGVSIPPIPIRYWASSEPSLTTI